ncbi:MAG TPA: hypothetical protein VGO42_01365 [Reyranella sp.]|nr:hypothetical protein [Reyranella sp.]
MAAGTIGNVLEWYDFSIYGFFAAAIGRTFFPEQEPVSQVLAAFGVFAAGYLMRPLGGIVVGHIGDRYGRTVALSFSAWRWRCRPSWSASCRATQRWGWPRRSCSRSCA